MTIDSAAYPILEITDGTDSVDLLSPSNGFHLNDWTPTTPEAKGGGIWYDGVLAEGRRLAIRKLGNTVDVFDLKVSDECSQDVLIQALQKLRRLLEKALTYSTADWQSAPVWMKVRAPDETNTRYTTILDYSAPADDNPFAQPFWGSGPIVVDEFSLAIEHGPWLSQPPGVGECVEAASYYTGNAIAPWASNTALPSGAVIAMLQTHTGRLLGSSQTDKKVWRTDDGGATPWTGSAALASPLYCLCEDAAGYIYGVSDLTTHSIFRSDDDGETWAVVNNVYGGLGYDTLRYRPQDGYLYFLWTWDNTLYRSNDLGVNWTACSGTLSYVETFVIADDGTLYCLALYSGGFFKSIDGTTWTKVGNLPKGTAGADLRGLFYPGDGYFYLFARTLSPSLYRSSDCISWVPVSSFAGTNSLVGMILKSDGMLYATISDNGAIWRSLPGGNLWVQVSDAGAGAWGIAERTATKQLYVGGTDLIWAEGASLLTIVGQLPTCEDTVYVANKSNLAVLTHIFVYDAAPATWTSIYPDGGGAAFPVNIFPAVPATGDILYCGIMSTAPQVGPFSTLIFPIVTPIAMQSHTITWEFSAGGGVWTALTGVTDWTDSFEQVGANSVSFVPPATWTTETVNGVAAYWIRARISASGGPISAAQIGADIYTVITSGLMVRAADVLGDLPALLHAWLTNRSDRDGVGGSTPDAWANRYLVGVRSTSRGAYFCPFLNFSDTQQPPDLTVAGTAATVAAANIQTATGRQYTHTGTGASTWSDQFTFTLSASVAASYYGRFRIFLRAQQHNCHVGDVRVRLKVVYGSGGLEYIGDYAAFASLSDWQLLDLGTFKFPPINTRSTDLGNQMQIVLQLWSNDNTADVHLYDLALIPTDEWAGNFTDQALISGSEVGGSYLLDLDSVGHPKEELRALVRAAGSEIGLIKSIYQPGSVGPAILQANADQQLYVLCARYASAVWYSEPWLTHSVKLQAAFRYLSMRGSR